MLNPNLAPLGSILNKASRLDNNLYRLAPTFTSLNKDQLRSMGEVYGCEKAVRDVSLAFDDEGTIKTIFF